MFTLQRLCFLFGFLASISLYLLSSRQLSLACGIFFQLALNFRIGLVPGRLFGFLARFGLTLGLGSLFGLQRFLLLAGGFRFTQRGLPLLLQGQAFHRRLSRGLLGSRPGFLIGLLTLLRSRQSLLARFGGLLFSQALLDLLFHLVAGTIHHVGVNRHGFDDLGLWRTFRWAGLFETHHDEPQQKQMQTEGKQEPARMAPCLVSGHSLAGRVMRPTLGTPACLRAAMIVTTRP